MKSYTTLLAIAWGITACAALTLFFALLPG